MDSSVVQLQSLINGPSTVGPPAAITALRFDPAQELLWVGNNEVR